MPCKGLSNLLPQRFCQWHLPEIPRAFQWDRRRGDAAPPLGSISRSHSSPRNRRRPRKSKNSGFQMLWKMPWWCQNTRRHEKITFIQYLNMEWSEQGVPVVLNQTWGHAKQQGKTCFTGPDRFGVMIFWVKLTFWPTCNYSLEHVRCSTASNRSTSSQWWFIVPYW